MFHRQSKRSLLPATRRCRSQEGKPTRLRFEHLDERILFSASGLDLTFNDTGYNEVSGPVYFTTPQSLVVQPDGKILALVTERFVLGAGEIGSEVLRFNANGALDTTFGNGGRLRLDPDPALELNATSMAVTDDGKIVIAGELASSFASSSPVLFRLDSHGVLDTTFGGTGTIVLISAQSVAIDSIAIQDDGKIVTAGHGSAAAGEQWHLSATRYNVNGSLDASFGDGGSFILTAIDGVSAAHVAIESSGRIVIGSGNGQLVGLTNGGELDDSFGAHGIAQRTATDSSQVEIADLKVDSQGAIVVAGQLYSPTLHTLSTWVARYTAEGAPDATFDGDGELTVHAIDPGAFSGNFDDSERLGVDSTGQITVLGAVFDRATFHSQQFLDRFDHEGTLDDTFGVGGELIPPAVFAGVTALTIDARGHALIAGPAPNHRNPTDNWVVGRLAARAAPDDHTLVLQTNGNSHDIQVTFTSANTFRVDANGNSTTYTVGTAAGQINRLELAGDASTNALLVQDTFNTYDVAVSAGQTALERFDFELDGSSFERVSLVGNQRDHALLAGQGTSLKAAVTSSNGSLTDAAGSFFYQVSGIGRTTLRSDDVSTGIANLYSAAHVQIVADFDHVSYRLGSTNYLVQSFGHTYARAAHAEGERFTLYGAPSSDKLVGTPTYAYMTGSYHNIAYFNEGLGFAKVQAFGRTGDNVAYLYGSAGNDRFLSKPSTAYLTGGSGAKAFLNQVSGFVVVNAYGQGGQDIATLYGSMRDDTFTATANSAILRSDVRSTAIHFARVTAIAAEGGQDTATPNGSASVDVLTASGSTAALITAAQSPAPGHQTAIGFDAVTVKSPPGVTDSKLIGAIDFSLNLIGQWR